MLGTKISKRWFELVPDFRSRWVREEGQAGGAWKAWKEHVELCLSWSSCWARCLRPRRRCLSQSPIYSSLALSFLPSLAALPVSPSGSIGLHTASGVLLSTSLSYRLPGLLLQFVSAQQLTLSTFCTSQFGTKVAFFLCPVYVGASKSLWFCVWATSFDVLCWSFASSNFELLMTFTGSRLFFIQLKTSRICLILLSTFLLSFVLLAPCHVVTSSCAFRWVEKHCSFEECANEFVVV